MPALHLSLLGPFSASLDDQPIHNFKTNKVQALLIYLAMEQRPHRRESLMELLWPGMPLESAQVNLRQTIYRLRQALPEQEESPILISDRQTVGLDPEAEIWLDVDKFQAQINDEPIKALEHYRGDFLADFYLVDSAEFENWAEGIRENLRRTALDALDRLTEAALEHKDFERAQKTAWHQLEIDKLREKAYRQLMISLVKSGQRNAALSQFQICKQRLAEELGIEPAQETLRLYDKIQADSLRMAAVSPPPGKKQTNREMPIFVLTDIEGSTRLWDTHHQAMLPALMQHNHILEEQIARYGGRILELRGDGVKAVFEGGDPLAAMIGVQRALGEADWGEIGELKIRIGLHGVPEVRKGYDFFKEDDQYYGPVLNHTARIMDAGWGGQILVSERVRNTCSLPNGASWQDFGAHRVKSLEQLIRIYGLIHPDLPHQDFPPLRTLSTEQKSERLASSRPRHNLPQQATPFVGRTDELADLSGLLDQPQIRLVSIVGPGGMGKTRLALALAEELIQSGSSNGNANPFSDGIFFVPLTSLDEPAQMIPAIAKALSVPIESGQSGETLERASQTVTTQKESLLGYLGNKQMLVILDNFEHLVEGAELVSCLLEMAPQLQILVTSRERLRIREEQVYPIQGLAFPAWEAPEDPCDYTAMELFLQSARRVQPDFDLSPGDMACLTRICQLVGGMPLGLELAASWVDLLSIQEIEAEIRSNLDFLKTGVRNVPDRHRSIRAVFDSSWGRLSEAEQAVFPRLSIFRGDFSRAAAEAVGLATLRILATLVSKSLIQYDQDTHRYRIHELLRQYGAEQLIAAPQDKLDTRQRHSGFYCAEVDRHFRLLMAGQTQTATDRMDLDFANIQAAWDWAIANGNIEYINQAINGICFAYDWDWQAEEALAACKSVISMLKRLNLPGEGTEASALLAQRLHAKALCWQGYFNLYFDHTLTSQYLKQSMEIIEQLTENGADARIEKCQILYYQGLVDYLSGDAEAAKQRFEESLATSKEINLHWVSLGSLEMLGEVAIMDGSPRKAKTWYNQSLTAARAQNNHWGEISALRNLGWAARHLIAYDESHDYYQESLQAAQKYEDQWGTIKAIEDLGFLAMFRGHLAEGLERFSQSVAISNKLGMPYRTLPSQVHIGFIHWMRGDFDQAEDVLQAAVALAQELTPAARLFPLIMLTEFFVLTGRYREAHAQINTISALNEGIFLNRFAEGRYLRILGWLALAERNYRQAQVQFEKSVSLYQTNSDDEQIAWSQVGLARALMGLGKMADAKSLLIDALWTIIEIQSFIPLVFALPVSLLYFSQEDPDRAAKIYQRVQSSPVHAKAQLFQDIAGRFLPDQVTQGTETAQTPNEDFQTRLWKAASVILSQWMQTWMEESASKEAYRES